MHEGSPTAGGPSVQSPRMSPAARRPRRPVSRLLAVPLAVGALVTLGIYVVASSITPDPTSGLFGTSGTGTFPLKSDLSSAVLALAALQVFTALWLYGKLRRRHATPPWLGRAHRVSGAAAIVLSLPIAYNCLVAYGFERYDRRVLVHALAGCFFYGAVAAKVLVVRSRRLPGWALPVAGGTLVALVFVLWYSAALWYYNGFDAPVLSPGVPSAPSYGYLTRPRAAPARLDGDADRPGDWRRTPATITLRRPQRLRDHRALDAST